MVIIKIKINRTFKKLYKNKKNLKRNILSYNMIYLNR